MHTNEISDALTMSHAVWVPLSVHLSTMISERSGLYMVKPNVTKVIRERYLDAMTPETYPMILSQFFLADRLPYDPVFRTIQVQNTPLANIFDKILPSGIGRIIADPRQVREVPRLLRTLNDKTRMMSYLTRADVLCLMCCPKNRADFSRHILWLNDHASFVTSVDSTLKLVDEVISKLKSNEVTPTQICSFYEAVWPALKAASVTVRTGDIDDIAVSTDQLDLKVLIAEIKAFVAVVSFISLKAFVYSVLGTMMTDVSMFDVADRYFVTALLAASSAISMMNDKIAGYANIKDRPEVSSAPQVVEFIKRFGDSLVKLEKRKFEIELKQARVLEAKGLFGQTEAFLTKMGCIENVDDIINDPNRELLCEALQLRALIVKRQGDYKRAFELQETVVSAAFTIFGDTHPKTSVYVRQLGDIYRKLGQFDEAYDQYKRALELTNKSLGPDSPDAAECLGLLGLVLKKKCEYELAVRVLNEALSVTKLYYGEEHIKTATIYVFLGDAYRKTGDYDRAAVQYKLALDLFVKLLGTDHPETVDAKIQLVVLYKKTGDLSLAEETSKGLLDKVNKTFGKAHPKVATLLSALGDLDRKKGLFKAALIKYNDALDIFKNCKDEAEAAEIMNLIGLTNKKMGDYAIALPVLTHALEISKKYNGVGHPKTAQILTNLGDVCRKLKKFTDSEKYYKEGIEINRNTYGAEHVEVADALLGYGLLLKKLHKYDDAARVLRESCDITIARMGEEHSKSALAKQCKQLFELHDI